jgi:hypothetical protein
MKPLLKAIAITLYVSCALGSCSPVPYAVIGHNTPLLQEKDEVNISASLATGTDASGLGIQTAWAIDSSVALMSSFYSMKSASSWDDPSDWKGNGRYFELGIGTFGKGKRNPRFVREAFFGTGFARIRNHYNDDKLDVNYMNIFIQGSLGFSNHWIDIALTPRIAYMHYTHKSYTFADAENRSLADDYFENNNSKLLFEPGITVRAGYKNVRLNLNYVTTTFDIRGGDIYNTDELQVNTEFFSIGLNYLFTKRFEKK